MSLRHLTSLAVTVLMAEATGVAQVSFVDVAASTGTKVTSFGRGVAWADLDRDGWLDVVSADSGMNISVLRQRSDHTFEDVFVRWGFADDSRSHWGVLAADFDNDGDIDLYILNGGFDGRQANQLLRNDLLATGVFTDVSTSSGDAPLSRATFGGCALDYDGDGLVDLFLSNAANQGCNLLHNEGGLVFKNRSAAAGISESGGNYRHCTAGDFDNDGWPDLGVGNYAGANLLYRNNGDGTFTDVAASAGLSSPRANFGVVLEDFDNDGWLDAYVPKYQRNPTGPSGLFVNRRDGTFLDVSVASGMPGNADMGHNVGDVDGDGYPDIFIGTGAPDIRMDDVLLLVVPDRSTGLRVIDVSASSGILASGPSRCHGSSFADYDGDGDVDLLNNNGGPPGGPSTLEDDYFWQNQGNGNGWISVDLVGVRSNRGAVGARAVVHTGTGREVHRQVTVGRGFGNTNAAQMNFGLADEQDVAELMITWPSGIKQRVVDLAMSESCQVIETGIALRGTPAVGAAVELDACGPPDEQVDVLVSTQHDWIPIPHLGVLELGDPLTVLASGLLDAEGRTTFTLDIPPDPALSGSTYHLQACVHAPGMVMHGPLTNRVTVVIL